MDRVHRIDRIEARLTDHVWPFEAERADEIAETWARLSANKPSMFNGRVLLALPPPEEAPLSRLELFAIDYASLLAWREMGWPETGVRLSFSAVSIETRDGAFLLGVMGEHTANAGKIGFPGGNLDLGDVRPKRQASNLPR
jgi:hypothetical protein